MSFYGLALILEIFAVCGAAGCLFTSWGILLPHYRDQLRQSAHLGSLGFLYGEAQQNYIRLRQKLTLLRLGCALGAFSILNLPLIYIASQLHSK